MPGRPLSEVAKSILLKVFQYLRKEKCRGRLIHGIEQSTKRFKTMTGYDWCTAQKIEKANKSIRKERSKNPLFQLLSQILLHVYMEMKCPRALAWLNRVPSLAWTHLIWLLCDEQFTPSTGSKCPSLFQGCRSGSTSTILSSSLPCHLYVVACFVWGSSTRGECLIKDSKAKKKIL